MFNHVKIRDITRIDIGDDRSLVIACDSAGGIGNKPGDTIQVTEGFLGSFTARVAMMEVLATGAEIISIIDTLSLEMEPSGRMIIEGIAREAGKAGLDPKIIITGSTEENIPVQQTGIGITVIGQVDSAAFRPGTTVPGDIIVCFGIPSVGQEVSEKGENSSDFADITLLRILLTTEGVHDILPVGSKGIRHEVKEMAASAGKNISLLPGCPLDLDKSAGPATCLLASMQKDVLAQLASNIAQPAHIIGTVD